MYDEKNPVESIIRYFSAIPEQRYDRLKHDCDAYYYKNHAIKGNGKHYTDEESKRGDVMISFWTPYQFALYCVTDWMYYKKIKTDGKPENWSLLCLLKNMVNQNHPKFKMIKEVNERFAEFARLCYTEGNFILLPDSDYKSAVKIDGEIKLFGMNQARFHFCEDRIDATLFECSSGRSLSGFFDKEKVNDWIVREKLDFIAPNCCTTKFKNMKIDEIFAYANFAVETIAKRNELLKNTINLKAEV